ncbi:uncharacterized protein LOC135277801 [Aotus nancymaae]|uniref:uncharacterized protein LOC135277801 n=1 Tax=Aotus nancymaae TaxID=37293 RepID=UPI0030FE6752
MGAGSANETCREDLRLLQPAGRLPLSAPPFPVQRENPSSQSRCSQSPRPSRPCSGPPPAVATSTTSVPLNRFLLHVNTYYRYSKASLPLLTVCSSAGSPRPQSGKEPLSSSLRKDET